MFSELYRRQCHPQQLNMRFSYRRQWLCFENGREERDEDLKDCKLVSLKSSLWNTRILAVVRIRRTLSSFSCSCWTATTFRKVICWTRPNYSNYICPRHHHDPQPLLLGKHWPSGLSVPPKMAQPMPNRCLLLFWFGPVAACRTTTMNPTIVKSVTLVSRSICPLILQ